MLPHFHVSLYVYHGFLNPLSYPCYSIMNNALSQFSKRDFSDDYVFVFCSFAHEFKEFLCIYNGDIQDQKQRNKIISICIVKHVFVLNVFNIL